MKIAIITGASSGMGREFVRQIGCCGQPLDEVWVIARRKERLEALRKESGLPLRVLEGDLLKETVFEQLGRSFEREYAGNPYAGQCGRIWEKRTGG